MKEREPSTNVTVVVFIAGNKMIEAGSSGETYSLKVVRARHVICGPYLTHRAQL